MAASSDSFVARTGKIIADLQALRHYAGPPSEFWNLFLAGAGQLSLAREVLLAVKASDAVPWTANASWPSQQPPAPELLPFWCAAADEALTSGVSVRRPAQGAAKADAWIGVRLEMGPLEPPSALALRVPDAPVDILESATLLLRMAADVPGAYAKERALNQASGDVMKFSEALDLMVLLNEDKAFMKAAMTLANELASRYDCSRVSLGWIESGYARLQAMSHVEKFEERTSAVHVVEACMEETADQDEEIVWPPPQGLKTVTRAHEEYVRNFGPGALVTLPLRLDGEVVGALMCERATGAFTGADVSALRLMCDQSTRRLADLKRQDRWFGRRWLDAVRDALGWVFGVKHTWAKVGGLALVGLFWFLAVGKLDYRVEGTFLLKTDDLVYLPAPFDGYIDTVSVQIGDEVKQGQQVLNLDTRELVLDQTAAQADISRQNREAEKAQARLMLADMQIATALKDQAKARLEKVEHNLENAKVKAPMAGLIVEGDLKKMLGAPVRRGDVLFKIARLERMYAEISVDERDIHEIKLDGKGEVAFVSRPNLSFPCTVERIDPVAVAREGKNEFTVRARLTGPSADWWRPGMSGVAKVDCGKRNVAWILTHRTVEFLRLMLWW